MPEPTKKELEENDEQGFVSRCIAYLAKHESDKYPDPKQRAAICYSMWRDAKGVKEGNGEVILQGVFESYGGPEGVAEGQEPKWDKWKIMILKHGLSLNRVMYTPEATQKAVQNKVFEGALIFDWSEEKHLNPASRPSIRDAVGWISSTESTEEGLIGTAYLHRSHPTATFIRDAYEAGRTDIGRFSIRAEGRIQPYREADGKVARRLLEFTRAHSVDFVINPGAGGAIISPVAEASNDGGLHMLEKKLAFLKEHAPDLHAKLDANNIDEAKVDEYILEVYSRLSDKQSSNTGDAAGDGDGGEGKDEDKINALTEALKQINELAKANEEAQKALRELKKRESKATIRAVVSESSLPQEAKDRVVSELENLIEAGTEITDEKVKERIKQERDYLAKLVQPYLGTQNSPTRTPSIEVGLEEGDKLRIAIDRFFFADDPAVANVSLSEGVESEPMDWKGVPAFTSARQMWVECTGVDPVMGRIGPPKQINLEPIIVDGQPFPVDGVLMQEAMSTTDFPYVLANSMTKRMLKELHRPNLKGWKFLVNIRPVSDLKTQDRLQFTGFGDLPTVAERAAYTDLGKLGERRVQYTPSKRGGYVDMSIETIINDDMRKLRNIPVYLARAYWQTINDYVENFLVGNGAIYDGYNLFDASNHANDATSANLSWETIAAGRLAMMKQTETVTDTGSDLGSTTRQLHIEPRYLLIPVDLQETAYDIITKAAKQNNAVANFVQSLNLSAYTLLTETTTNRWYLVADPKVHETIELGFLGGRTAPEIYVQNRQTEGKMFTNDVITWKIRIWFGGAVTDYRSFYRGTGA